MIAAYYYHSSSMPVSAIPVSRLNDIIYAFDSINSAGQCSAPDAPTAADFAALGRLKRSHPGLRTEISVGGWGASGFSDAALTTESRTTFVDSCMKLVFGTYRGDFDGIDFDWEFPVYGGAPGTAAARRPSRLHPPDPGFPPRAERRGPADARAPAAHRGAARRPAAV